MDKPGAPTFIRSYRVLNSELQRGAIDAALTRTCTVIQGPPGTGKLYSGNEKVYLPHRKPFFQTSS